MTSNIKMDNYEGSVTLPITFTQLALATAPNTGLQPYPAWMTFARTITRRKPADAEPQILPLDNTAYTARISKISVTTGSISGLDAEPHERYWKSVVSECSFISAAPSTPVNSHSLAPRLDSITQLELDPMLASISARSDSHLHLSTDDMRWENTSLRWNDERTLQGILNVSSFQVANALLALLAPTKGSDYVMELVSENDARSIFPQLSKRFAGRADYYLVTGDTRSTSTSSMAATSSSSSRAPSSSKRETRASSRRGAAAHANGPKKLRCSAVIELKPFVSLTFLAFVAYYLRRLFGQGGESPVDGEPYCNRLKALQLAAQLFHEAAQSGAPLIILFTGWHFLILERIQGKHAQDIKLHIHLLIIAQDPPTPSSEPQGPAAAALFSLWTVSTARNLPCALVLLCALADSLECFEGFKPASPPKGKGKSKAVDETAPFSGSSATHTADAPASQPAQASTSNTASKTAPLLDTHTLLCQSAAFAKGLRSEAYQACLVPSPEAWDGCYDLGTYDVDSSSSCSQSSHQRAVAKTARKRGGEQESEGDLEYADSESRLAAEAHVYEELQHLQGKTLARFYGRWGEEETYYLYENMGVTLANSSDVASLKLSAAEKLVVASQLRSCLDALHKAGYAHGDVFARNVCIRRMVPQTPPMPSSDFRTMPPATPEHSDAPRFDVGPTMTLPDSPPKSKAEILQSSLIDLTEAKLLSSLSYDKQEAAKAKDAKELEAVLAAFAAEKCS